MSDNLEYRARKVVADVFDLPLDQVELNTSNKTVENWDSLNLINLMIGIESEFDITLGVEQAIKLVSVEAILDILRNKDIN
ncbi:MAG: acyl carrier protein [Planctomycetota bacterium]|jgi:acyl carrier protein